jgi:hypothetical protein
MSDNRFTDHLGRPIIAVTGMGVITSLGQGLQDNWAALTSGTSGIHKITRFPTEGLVHAHQRHRRLHRRPSRQCRRTLLCLRAGNDGGSTGAGRTVRPLRRPALSGSSPGRAGMVGAVRTRGSCTAGAS